MRGVFQEDGHLNFPVVSEIEKIGKGVVGTEVSIVTLIMSRFIFHSF